MKFPDDPKTSVQLEEFLNSFAKKHSKGSGILLPGALKYYIPHTISAHESLGSIPESAATEIAKVRCVRCTTVCLVRGRGLGDAYLTCV